MCPAVCNLILGAIIEEWTTTAPNGGSSATSSSSRRALEQLSKNISESLFSAYTLVADRAAHLHPSHIAVGLTTVAMARAALALLRMRLTVLRAIQLTLFAALILRPNNATVTTPPTVSAVSPTLLSPPKPSASSPSLAAETIAPHSVSGRDALVNVLHPRASIFRGVTSRIGNSAAIYAQTSALMTECALLLRERITDADVIIKRLTRLIPTQHRSRL